MADSQSTTLEQQLGDTYDSLNQQLGDGLGFARYVAYRRGAGFVLTVYRRRLTSSWAAIHKTLLKRLASEETFLELTFGD